MGERDYVGKTKQDGDDRVNFREAVRVFDSMVISRNPRECRGYWWNKRMVLDYSHLFPPPGTSGTPRTQLWYRLVQEAPSMSSAHLSVSLSMRPSSSVQSPSLGTLLMPLAAAYARRLER